MGNYVIGYKKPPAHAQFKKGQTGNRKGRPRGSRGLKTILREEVSERISLTERGKRRTLTKQQIVVKALINKAMSGDIRASSKLLDLIVKILGLEEPTAEESSLTDSDRAIVEAYYQRRKKWEDQQ